MAISFLALPTTAEAVVPVKVVGGIGTQREGQIIQINQQILNNIARLVEKEFTLDPAANNVKMQNAIAYYNTTKQMVASGDNGNPYFITNINLYEKQIHATSTAHQIEDLRGSNICDAFEDELIAKLKERYIAETARSTAEKTTCSLDTATENNTAAFLEGDYEQGGIQAMFNMAQNPDQSPLGAIFETEATIKERADKDVENAMTEAGWGDGFKSRYNAQQNVLVCTRTDMRDQCTIATPASLIKERAAGLPRMEFDIKMSGDEHQETESSMIDAVIQPTLAGGITGRAAPISTTPPTTPPQNGGGNGGGNNLPTSDPFPNVPNNPQNPTTQSFLVQVTGAISQAGASSTNPVRPILVRTLTKLQYELETVGTVTDAETLHASTTDKYAPYNCFDLDFSNSLLNQRILHLGNIPNTIGGIKKLYALFLRYEEAAANNTSTNQIIADLQTVLSLNIGIIPTQADLNNIAEEYTDFLNNELAPYNSELNQQIAACELIVNPPENDNDDNSSGGGG